MSLGLSQEEYWEMTPYQLELVQEAENRRWEKDKRVEIFTINSIVKMMSKNAKGLTWKNFLGIFVKTYRSVTEFESVKAYFDYLEEEGVEGIGEYRANCSRDNSNYSGTKKSTTRRK